MASYGERLHSSVGDGPCQYSHTEPQGEEYGQYSSFQPQEDPMYYRHLPYPNNTETDVRVATAERHPSHNHHHHRSVANNRHSHNHDLTQRSPHHVASRGRVHDSNQNRHYHHNQTQFRKKSDSRDESCSHSHSRHTSSSCSDCRGPGRPSSLNSVRPTSLTSTRPSTLNRDLHQHVKKNNNDYGGRRCFTSTITDNNATNLARHSTVAQNSFVNPPRSSIVVASPTDCEYEQPSVAYSRKYEQSSRNNEQSSRNDGQSSIVSSKAGYGQEASSVGQRSEDHEQAVDVECEPEGPLSPMTASYYEATGCLRDEWGPGTPLSPPAGWLGDNSDGGGLTSSTEHPTSPRSASFYAAVGSFPNAWKLQSPSSEYYPGQAENQSMELDQFAVGCARSPFAYSQQSNSSPFLYSPNTDTAYQGYVSSPADQSDFAHSNLDLDSANHPDQLAHSNSFPSPVTTPIAQDFVGLLEHHTEVSVTRREILDHNQQRGFQDWFAFKGNVYTTAGFKDHFIAYNSKKESEEGGEVPDIGSDPASSQISISEIKLSAVGETSATDILISRGAPKSNNNDRKAKTNKTDQHPMSSCFRHYSAGCGRGCVSHGRDSYRSYRDKHEDGESDDDDDDLDSGPNSDEDYDDTDVEDNDEDDDSDDEDSLLNEQEEYNFMWKYDVLAALRKSGLSTQEIESEIGVFRIGTLRDPTQPRWKYWENVRADVIGLHDDMQSRHDVTEYEGEYLTLLKRWLRKHRDMDPDETRRAGREDWNLHVFLLSPDQDPESLRPKCDLPPFDTNVPESGWVWETAQFPQLPPLTDTHQVFASTLRSHYSDDATQFRHDIDGDVAWSELPLDVIKDDVMTQNQRDVMSARSAQGSDVTDDPRRMEKKRKRLGRYFAKKYKLGENVMNRFLSWADLMEKNRTELENMCA